MHYKVLFAEEAKADFKALDGSVKKLVAKQMKKLEESPHLGQPLGNMRGFDLTGYYKLYAVRKSIRIVYRIIENEVVVEIVGIGKRADFEVYADVAKRLLRRK
ncbi:MAG: type II toxin-antitoxin system mRNA interferase toxin, RelE/StbE family [Deltaproteobacteria bacterium]|nr:type II toxin-antitoxin system mRNA interferase toxin, RelE/StbE family [Deltaproteobacteria bacterium]